MEARVKLISNKARFILENIDKKISVMNVKKKDLVKLLQDRGYDSDPVKAWKAKIAREQGVEFDDEDQNDDEEQEDAKEPLEHKKLSGNLNQLKTQAASWIIIISNVMPNGLRLTSIIY